MPTYTVATASGEQEVHEHNATTLTTDEEKAAWAAYQKTQTAYYHEINGRVIRMVLARCVIFDMPADSTWANNQALLGIPVPASGEARRLHYLETEVIGCQADVDTIWELAQLASGVTKAAITAAEATFPPGAQGAPADGAGDGRGAMGG